MKKPSSKKVSSNTAKMIAIFVAGVAVSTVAWYSLDRLDVAFGQSGDVNIIRESNRSGFAPCDPGEKPVPTRKLEGCQVITTRRICSPSKKYLKTERTRSGSRVVESDSPKRGSTQITKYDVVTQQTKKDIAQELAETNQKLETAKMGGISLNDPFADDSYENILKTRDELKKLQQKCMPTKQRIMGK